MKISLHPSFVGYILILCILSGPASCFGLIAALLIHELGHLAAAVIIREPIDRIDIGPFGGVMRYKPGATASKGIRGLILSLAGPLANYASILIISMLGCESKLPVYRSVVIANLSLMLINVLPALPLDGGAALFSIGYYLFDVSKLIACLCANGMLLGLAFCVFAFAGVVIYAKLNLTLVIVGVYLIACARRYKSEMYTQNAYALIHERAMKAKVTGKAVVYRLTGEERLYSLIEYLSRKEVPLFVLEQADGSMQLLSDGAVLKGLLSNPSDTINSFAEKQGKNERKSE